ncbi:MAG: hypothetical protein EB023_15240, partial [Flavobacteriia bacterium]|nr:hypothetical protein [Flavobacteriia bacterium]
NWRQLAEMYVNCYADIVNPIGIATGSYEALDKMYTLLNALQTYITNEANKITKLFDCALIGDLACVIDHGLFETLKAKKSRPAAGGAGRREDEEFM